MRIRVIPTSIGGGAKRLYGTLAAMDMTHSLEVHTTRGSSPRGVIGCLPLSR